MHHTFIFIISFFAFARVVCGQTTPEVATDTLVYKEKFGLRLGVDLSKPVRTLVDEDYSGIEVMGDYRIYKNYYLAAELGMEEKTTYDDNLSSVGSGNYIKIGFDYNAHKNWIGLNNMIFGGLRYGIASFEQELLEYSIATQLPYFPPDVRREPVLFEGLNMQWVELIIGVKTEILNNLYLSLNVQIKNRLNEKKPENFDNLFVPGFGRTYLNSNFGAGFGYGISYLIPVVKR